MCPLVKKIENLNLIFTWMSTNIFLFFVETMIDYTKLVKLIMYLNYFKKVNTNL